MASDPIFFSQETLGHSYEDLHRETDLWPLSYLSAKHCYSFPSYLGSGTSSKVLRNVPPSLPEASSTTTVPTQSQKPSAVEARWGKQLGICKEMTVPKRSTLLIVTLNSWAWKRLIEPEKELWRSPSLNPQCTLDLWIENATRAGRNVFWWQVQLLD